MQRLTNLLTSFQASRAKYAENFDVRENELCFGHSAGLVGDCQG